jgi:hypothetical protein
MAKKKKKKKKKSEKQQFRQEKKQASLRRIHRGYNNVTSIPDLSEPVKTDMIDIADLLDAFVEDRQHVTPDDFLNDTITAADYLSLKLLGSNGYPLPKKGYKKKGYDG